MKIEVKLNIEKKHFFIILSTILILTAVFAVNAYNSSGTGGVPSNIGHSVDEIDWSKIIPGNITLGSSTLELGANDPNKATTQYGHTYGTINYNMWGGLSILGAGNSLSVPNRNVNIYDNVNIYNNLTVGTPSSEGNLCLKDGCKNAWSQVGSSRVSIISTSLGGPTPGTATSDSCNVRCTNLGKTCLYTRMEDYWGGSVLNCEYVNAGVRDWCVCIG